MQLTIKLLNSIIGHIKIFDDYSLVDLDVFDKPVVIIHKNFIQTLSIEGYLEKTLDFIPTKNLKLSLEYEHSSVGKLIEFL